MHYFQHVNICLMQDSLCLRTPVVILQNHIVENTLNVQELLFDWLIDWLKRVYLLLLMRNCSYVRESVCWPVLLFIFRKPVRSSWGGSATLRHQRGSETPSSSPTRAEIVWETAETSVFQSCSTYVFLSVRCVFYTRCLQLLTIMWVYLCALLCVS